MQAYQIFESHTRGLIENAEAIYSQNCLSPELASLIQQSKAAISELKTAGSCLSTTEQYQVAKGFTDLERRVYTIETNYQNEQSRATLMGNINSSTKISDEMALNQTQKMGEESIQIGMSTIERLRNQKEKLNGTHQTLGDIIYETEDAGRTVGRMAKIQRRNKLIMWGIVALLVVAILLILYMQF